VRRHQWVLASVIKDSGLLSNMERLSGISLRASYRREELDCDATLSVGEQFDPDNLAEVTVVAAFTGAVIGECYQQAHAFLIVLTLGEEVKSLT
jgi:hypothetical protein